jgi:hypothetical protein
MATPRAERSTQAGAGGAAATAPDNVLGTPAKWAYVVSGKTSLFRMPQI